MSGEKSDEYLYHTKDGIKVVKVGKKCGSERSLYEAESPSTVARLVARATTDTLVRDQEALLRSFENKENAQSFNTLGCYLLVTPASVIGLVSHLLWKGLCTR